MMGFEEFKTAVRDGIKQRMGDSYEIKISEVKKNNGTLLSGITLWRKGHTVTPNIYLNDYYNHYTKGEMTLEEVMDDYYKSVPNKNADVSDLLDYDEIRENVAYKLINREFNRELLDDVPHIDFLDLAVVFEYVFTEGYLYLATMLIHNIHLKLWDTTAGDLYRAAQENTPRLRPHMIQSMPEVLCGIMEADNPEGFDRDKCMAAIPDAVPMYVLSNRSRVHGAACILYPDVVRDFADTVGSSLYIILSSIHELLFIPVTGDESTDEIKAIIREINDTQVQPEEVLSYSLYYYDRAANEIVKL